MASSDPFRMAAVGDINLAGFATDSNPFRHLMPYLDTLNLAVGTLEGLLAEPAELFYKPGFKHVGEGHAPNLAEARFRMLNLASNVTFGAEPIGTTIKQLDAEGIAHTGAGSDRSSARRAARSTVDGKRIGMVSRTAVFWPHGHEATETQAGVVPVRVATSYQPHPRLIELPGLPAKIITTPDAADVDALRADLAAERDNVDVLIAFFHFGVSSQREVVDYQRTLAQAAIDAGADVVFGSHAHVVQPIEVYRGKPIFYGLSQVIFGWDFVARVKHPGQPGLIAELEVADGEFRWSARFVKPQENLEPRIVALDEVPEEVEHLAASCPETVRFEGDRLIVNTGLDTTS
ncbi:CapA family protein [Saccharopolyspora sp. K220]|uniref:CapA family protein n=1 Tax=Saccharopolyspora soli TaxID=2926618 RepID=UPI001F572620|nr:CapA family protein [Saccharopolyspora soli]MCI2417805.1 CapA family protein [Saccharopolyspora soli]